MGQLLLFVMILGIKSFEPGTGIDWLALVLPCAWSFFFQKEPFDSRRRINRKDWLGRERRTEPLVLVLGGSPLSVSVPIFQIPLPYPRIQLVAVVAELTRQC